MASKIKKLCKKAKKGLKNVVSPKKHTKGQNDKLKHSIGQPLKLLRPTLWQKTSRVENIKKDNEWAKKSLKMKPIEKHSKKGNMFKNVFKKLKGKVKKLNPIKSKKNKIIGSKKLAFLLTAGTIVAILPMFNLAPLPALAITSACIFSINFVAVKTLKKVIKQRKLTAKSKEEPMVAEPGKLEDISVESVTQEESKQISRDFD